MEYLKKWLIVETFCAILNITHMFDLVFGLFCRGRFFKMYAFIPDISEKSKYVIYRQYPISAVL